MPGRSTRAIRICSIFACAIMLLWPMIPLNAQPTLTKTSDSIVDSNALLMPEDATWGRAINGMSFQADALLTYNGYQYTAWYTNDDDLSVMIARRFVSNETVGDWNIVDTGSDLEFGGPDTSGTPWNAHNVISLGISAADGRIHLSWDQHDWRGVRYRVSKEGVASDKPWEWNQWMFGAENDRKLGDHTIWSSSYPTFVSTPSGGLHFAYRTKQSGNGDFMIGAYVDGSWRAPAIVIGKSGEYTEASTTSNSRNGYINGFDYGPDGTLHVTWTWRETPSGSDHDINYAYSEDGGVIWKNTAGQVVANTAIGDALSIDDAGLVIQALDLKQSLRSQQGQAVDTSGRVHVLMAHRRQEPDYEWESGDKPWSPLDSAYYHYVRDTNGVWSQHRLPVEVEIDGVTEPVYVGTRPKIGFDASGDVYAVFINRDESDGSFAYTSGDLIIAGASAASEYTDWSILHIETLPEGVGLISEPMIDQQRLLEHDILAIFAQEDAPGVPGATGTSLHVLEFAIPEPGAAAALSLGAFGLIQSRRRSSDR